MVRLFSKQSYSFQSRDKHGTDNGLTFPAPISNDLQPQSEAKGPDEGVDNIERGQWSNKAEFVLSCIGLSVGLGNVWRFPYLAFKNGGAAFLIAYLILQLLIGKPLYFMELVMGQFSAKGPTKVWDMNPAAKGIGIAMCLISLNVAIYYNVIMAYTLYYFFSSMQTTLPWTVCKEEWGACTTQRKDVLHQLCTINMTFNLNTTACKCTDNATLNEQISTLLHFNCTPAYKTATELYFKKEVIGLSAGIEYMGTPLWKLTLCLLLAWIIVCLCLIKGVKSSGKVVYFTATFPYVILLILLVRGAMLDGAIDGVAFFIIPTWERLLDIKVWAEAAGQMFFSLGLSFGGIIMYGSYNKFTNKVYGDSLLVSAMDLVTSVIAGFVVFTTLGNMAKILGTSIENVADRSYGLAFIVYPEALSNLPIPQLWSVLFFFMLFTLGLDSEFGMMETVLTCIQDEFPKMRKYKSVLIVTLGVCLFFLALPCVCNAGHYVVTIMDHYGADFSVLILACFEVISVMWVYGVRRFLKDIEYMLGHKPHLWPYWVFCWTFTSPILIALLFLYRMVIYSPPEYDEVRVYPQFAQAIGWTLLCVILSPVLLWFLWHTFRTVRKNDGLSTIETIKQIFKPTDEWIPGDGNKNYLLQNDVYQMEKFGINNPVIVSDNIL